jgi:hypothetical protein
MTVEDFKAYARDPQVTMPYASLPESAQKKAMLDDLLSFELLAEAGTRAGFEKDSAYTQIAETAMPAALPDALYDKHHWARRHGERRRSAPVLRGAEDGVRASRVTHDAPTRRRCPPSSDALAKGEPFSQSRAARRRIRRPSQNGGEVPGWLTLGQLPPDIETAVEPLKVGEHHRCDRAAHGHVPLRGARDAPAQGRAAVRAGEGRRDQDAGEPQAWRARRLVPVRSQEELFPEGRGSGLDGGRREVMQLPDSLARLLSTDPNARA